MCLKPPSCKQRRRRGSAIIEAALMVPWIYFLFVGVFDVGFYCYALMSTVNAARIAGLQASQSYTDTTTAKNYACSIVLLEMQDLPNVGNTATCGGGTVNVTATCVGVGGGSSCGSSCTGVCALKITVDYLTLPLIPIPGLLASQYTFEQSAEMVFGN